MMHNAAKFEFRAVQKLESNVGRSLETTQMMQKRANLEDIEKTLENILFFLLFFRWKKYIWTKIEKTASIQPRKDLQNFGLPTPVS